MNDTLKSKKLFEEFISSNSNKWAVDVMCRLGFCFCDPDDKFNLCTKQNYNVKSMKLTSDPRIPERFKNKMKKGVYRKRVDISPDKIILLFNRAKYEKKSGKNHIHQISKLLEIDSFCFPFLIMLDLNADDDITSISRRFSLSSISTEIPKIRTITRSISANNVDNPELIKGDDENCNAVFNSRDEIQIRIISPSSRTNSICVPNSSESPHSTVPHSNSLGAEKKSFQFFFNNRLNAVQNDSMEDYFAEVATKKNKTYFLPGTETPSDFNSFLSSTCSVEHSQINLSNEYVLPAYSHLSLNNIISAPVVHSDFSSDPSTDNLQEPKLKTKRTKNSKYNKLESDSLFSQEVSFGYETVTHTQTSNLTNREILLLLCKKVDQLCTFMNDFANGNCWNCHLSSNKNNLRTPFISVTHSRSNSPLRSCVFDKSTNVRRSLSKSSQNISTIHGNTPQNSVIQSDSQTFFPSVSPITPSSPNTQDLNFNQDIKNLKNMLSLKPTQNSNSQLKSPSLP